MSRAIITALFAITIIGCAVFAFRDSHGQDYSTPVQQPWRVDPNGAGYRVQYPDGNFVDVGPCGASLCIYPTAPGLNPPIDPSFLPGQRIAPDPYLNGEWQDAE
jgi:hypothetical protein